MNKIYLTNVYPNFLYLNCMLLLINLIFFLEIKFFLTKNYKKKDQKDYLQANKQQPCILCSLERQSAQN